ncbi:MAG TPA: hypothetical protein VD996_17385 [Chitinophagaceae bacterium]|nr:hypothetical protein [Chitinophagaceae bacterium]
MERDSNQFSPELLEMMRNEEREKFLDALKNGASWGQLYQIRRTIKKLNDMIEAADGANASDRNTHASSAERDEAGPRNRGSS